MFCSPSPNIFRALLGILGKKIILYILYYQSLCYSMSIFVIFGAADSDLESTDTDDEFQICDVCSTGEVIIANI